MLKPKSIISGPELIVSRPKWIVCEAKLNVSKAKAVIYGPHLINCVTNIIISAPLCSNVPPKIGASLTFSLPERAALFRSHRSEEHTSELQSRLHLVCRLLLEKKKARQTSYAASRTH